MNMPPSHIKDLAGYIFFSPNTKGTTGRAVKIHTDLFLEFFCAVDPGSAEGLGVIRDIEGLRVNPAAFQPPSSSVPPSKSKNATHKDLLSKINSTLGVMTRRQEQCLVTKNLIAYFHIHQLDGDQHPTVYISEIQIKRSEWSSEGGLLKVVNSRFGDKFEKELSLDLDGKGVYVSRACAQANEAFAYLNAIQNRADMKVFFNPQSTANDLGVWSQNRLSQSTQKLVSEMRELIRQNATKSVYWLLDGEGAALFAKAIKGLPGKLERHSFKFNNPRANLPDLLGELSTRNAKFNNEFIDYSGDRMALLALGSQHTALAHQILNLPGAADGYNKMARTYLAKQISALGKLKPVNDLLFINSGLRTSTDNFINILNKARSLYK